MRRWLYLPVLLLGVLKLTCAFHHSRRLCLRLPSLQVDTGRTHDVSNLDVYSLDSVRSTLIRQEETIIFALIERAQYRRNKKIYDSRNSNLTNSNDDPISFLEWMFIETEKLHAKVRRYTSPEEHPFFPDFLPSPILPALQYPEILKQETADINVNAEIMKWYIGGVIERLCEEGDDEQHGSSVLCDITAMQAISRRIHFGKFVAGTSVCFRQYYLTSYIVISHHISTETNTESKFRGDPEGYIELTRQNDVAGILKLLTDVGVEKKVLRRAHLKASTYGRDISVTTLSSSGHSRNAQEQTMKVDPMAIVELYRDMIIPLTKDIEVRYLFRRAGLEPPPQSDYFHLCAGPIDAFDELSSI